MEIKGSTFKRTRTLRSGEHKQLFDACKECRGVNKYYAPVVIAFAIATGMRLQEIFSLKLIDIDKKARTITIRESKTDKKQDIPGRVIVLPLIVEHWLNQLSKSSLEQIKHIYEIKDKLGSFATKDMEHLLAFQAFIETKKLFPMTKDAFKQAWKDIVKRSGIPSKEEDAKTGVPEHARGLEFLDLRREAGSRFNAADLNSDQHDLMLGHNANKIRGVYIAPSPQVVKAIADKLDRHTLGFTKDEFDKQYAGEKDSHS